MAQILALEWDAREARMAVARRSGSSIVVEQAFSIDLAPRASGDVAEGADEIGDRIASAIAERGVGRLDTIVAVGRASIELRVLNVPPVPKDELPDVVRFQAVRQFTTLGDDWPLDYVVLDSNEEGSNVLAATISPELVQQIQDTCAASELTPGRLVLRPFAATSLLRSRGRSSGCRMIIDMLADEADLTVVVDQQVVFMRTIRRQISDDVDQMNRIFIGEIRRTIVAAQNQLGGRSVEGIVLCGVADDHGPLTDAIESQLSLDVELFNPFDGVSLGSQLRQNLPEYPGRFAPLLGMLTDEASGTAHTIDFLNPRRRPEKPSQIRRNSLIGGAACLVLVCVVLILWSMMAAQKRELQSLRTKRDKLKTDEPVALEIIKRADEIDKWVAGDVNWLDELRELSDEIHDLKKHLNEDSGSSSRPNPTVKQTIITRLVARAQPEGGRLSFDGVATRDAVLPGVGRAIRDDRHTSAADGPWPSELVEGYEKEFRQTVTVKKYDPNATSEKKPSPKVKNTKGKSSTKESAK